MMKDIEGFPGYRINENGVVINKKGHVMRTAISNTGYLRTSLETYDENGKLIKRYNKSIHRLVAQTFLPNPDNLPVVMHLDNDPLHDHASNLKWGTHEENMAQMVRDGRRTKPNKGNHDTYVYDVYKGNDHNYCPGCKGVAELLGYTSPKSVRPGVIKSGTYEGYTVENTKKKAICPIIFTSELQ